MLSGDITATATCAMTATMAAMAAEGFLGARVALHPDRSFDLV